MLTALFAAVTAVVASTLMLHTEAGCNLDAVDSWLTSWSDVKLHPSVRVAEAHDGCGLSAERYVPHRGTILMRVRPDALIVAPSFEELAVELAMLVLAVEAGNTSTRQLQYLHTVMRNAASDDSPANESQVDWCGPTDATPTERIPCQLPLRVPALEVPWSVAKQCLAPHPRRLLSAAHKELQTVYARTRARAARTADTHARLEKRHARTAWAIVRTRAVDGPTDVEQPAVHASFLVPGIDFANMQTDGRSAPNTVLEYQRTQAAYRAPVLMDGEDEADDMTARSRESEQVERPTRLDVLLTASRSLRKGAEVILDYGNVRHPLDALDTYGVLPRNDSSGAVVWHALLPVQLGFPRTQIKGSRLSDRASRATDSGGEDFFDAYNCRNESVMVFNATTGKPAPAVLTCVALAQLSTLGKGEADTAIRQYLSGGMSKTERKQLMAAAWRALAYHANSTILTEYTPPADLVKSNEEEDSLLSAARDSPADAPSEDSQCATALQQVGDKRRRVRATQALRDLWAATAFMRDAFSRLNETASLKAQSMRPATDSNSETPASASSSSASQGEL